MVSVSFASPIKFPVEVADGFLGMCKGHSGILAAFRDRLDDETAERAAKGSSRDVAQLP